MHPRHGRAVKDFHLLWLCESTDTIGYIVITYMYVDHTWINGFSDTLIISATHVLGSWSSCENWNRQHSALIGMVVLNLLNDLWAYSRNTGGSQLLLLLFQPRGVFCYTCIQSNTTARVNGLAKVWYRAEGDRCTQHHAHGVDSRVV